MGTHRTTSRSPSRRRRATLAVVHEGLSAVRTAPADAGTVELIVRRPAPGEREELVAGLLTVDDGLVGDSWRARGSRHTPDGSAEPNRQLTLMGARAIALFAGEDRARWSLAGDQLFVDLDISEDNLPAGTVLRLGADAAIQVAAEPHTGCAKFLTRYGRDASRLVNSAEGRRLRLRGLNARVVTPGEVRVGDPVSVVRQPAGPSPARSASR
jgi:MOSC domain-containing protein YiiM